MGMMYRELLHSQPVLAAPMCGISDYPFRELCRRMGAGFTFTQMVSAVGIRHGDKRTLEILDVARGGEEPLLGMQLFGGDPDALAYGAQWLQEHGADVVDLNMGCPARKVVGGNSGSALLKNLPLVAEIFRKMRRAVSVPLTVKMRWDWDEETGQGAALEAARMAQAEGLDAVCLHARTRQQGYSGSANWELIARMKEAVDIPVIGNGDIRSPADALEMMRRSGCEAVMIGRGVIGDPWLLGECLQAVKTGQAVAMRTAPGWEERRRVMLLHAGLMFERRGTQGIIMFRKHAAMYLRALPGAKRMREQLVRVSTLEQLEEILATSQPEVPSDPPAAQEHAG